MNTAMGISPFSITTPKPALATPAPMSPPTSA